MSFRPPFCPYPECSKHDGAGFRWTPRGSYVRACDGVVVPRYSCRTCRRRFSRQTFRFNYRWWRPHVHHELFRGYTSKVTMRQIARSTGVSRGTVARRLRAMGRHCKGVHESLMRAARLDGTFVMDEGETFETDRLVRPVTFPVVVQKGTLFVVHAETAPMPPRGRLNAYRQLRKLRDEGLFGKRLSGSRAAVEHTLLKLKACLVDDSLLHLITDRKSSYRRLVATHFRGRVGSHVQESSRRKRDTMNPLFAINHTLAMMRDGISRLVRRNWAHAKLRSRLEEHMWVWIGYRNYVRGRTVKETRETPAMQAGVVRYQLRTKELFRWRWPRRIPVA